MPESVKFEAYWTSPLPVWRRHLHDPLAWSKP